MIFLITGTGTDVGKTIATATLATVLANTPFPETSDGPAIQETAEHNLHIVKVAQTGEAEGVGDAETIRRLTGAHHLHELARYPDPLAPLTAAQHSGLPPLNLDHAIQSIENLDGAGKSTVLVEGAGGALVQLGLDKKGNAWTLVDLAQHLAAEVIVVTSTGLGSLNHAALTLDVLHARGVRCAGLIGGCVPAQPDLATELNLKLFTSGDFVPEHLHAPWLGHIPAGAGALSRNEFTARAPHWLHTPKPAE